MGKLKRKICSIGFALAKKMPRSNAKFNFGAKKLRYLCAKNMIKSCGKNVNFEKGAKFGYDLSIGDNSVVAGNPARVIKTRGIS